MRCWQQGWRHIHLLREVPVKVVDFSQQETASWLAKREAKETGQEAFPVPGLPLPSTLLGEGGSSITTGYCPLQLPSVGPNKSHI